jgi:adenosylcobinamide-GDP ribazoletransferase
VPAVGGGIGLAVGGAYVVLLEAFVPILAATMAVGLGIALTGGLHEDGLADVSDAAGGTTVADRRRILHDPRVGSFGALALGLSLLVRVGAVASMAGWDAVGALVAAHALGRGAAVGLIARFEPMADDGLGVRWAGATPRRHILTGFVAAAVLAGVGLGWRALPAVASVALVAVVVRRWSLRALGGMNGDVLGATEQLAEMAVLVIAAAGTMAAA